MAAASNGLKIHIHDFAGHPFQAELSNELSESGFTLKHTFFGHIGPTKALAEDIYRNGRIEFEKITLRQKYEVHSLVKRLWFELKLSGKLLLIHWRFKPDVTIFANTPLISASIFRLLIPKAKFVLWHQDIFSRAINLRLQNDVNQQSNIQKLLVRAINGLESNLAKKADEIICISEAFLSVYDEWSLDPSKVNVIENWAPLNQIQLTRRTRDSDLNLDLVYAGTLGLKHNPQLLIDLMQELEKVGKKVNLVVISEGDGSNFLKEQMGSISTISLLKFVPISILNQKLSDSDVAIMLLEEGASEFSVPSKTYSYLAAGKMILAFAPNSNAASLAIRKAGGYVFEPSKEGVLESIDLLRSLNMKALAEKETQAREFAVDNFQIDKKAELFIQIIKKVLQIP